MNFFSYQPEYISTINVILGSKFGSWPATLTLGIVFALLVISAYVIFHKRFSVTTIIFTAAAVSWLPLFAQFAYSSSKEFNETWFVLNLPQEEQTIWRYCRIDKYQQLGGALCGLYPFIEKVREEIPRDSSISIASSGLHPYLVYYLYPSYRVTEEENAEYLIIFFPNKKIDVSDDFELLKSYGPNDAIFKKKS